jgi:hypothetical protein
MSASNQKNLELTFRLIAVAVFAFFIVLSSTNHFGMHLLQFINQILFAIFRFSLHKSARPAICCLHIAAYQQVSMIYFPCEEAFLTTGNAQQSLLGLSSTLIFT